MNCRWTQIIENMVPFSCERQISKVPFSSKNTVFDTVTRVTRLPVKKYTFQAFFVMHVYTFIFEWSHWGYFMVRILSKCESLYSLQFQRYFFVSLILKNIIFLSLSLSTFCWSGSHSGLEIRISDPGAILI